MKSIGGYFELELSRSVEYHRNAVSLNSGRNAFEYILMAKSYSKIFVPFYTCDVMLEPLDRLGIDYMFYHIDEQLEPVSEVELKSNEGFLYTNYFGIKNSTVKDLSEIYGNSLIVDNAQAFYSKPVAGIDTLYSPRKFFGVPDGGYLYTDKKLDLEFIQDVSVDRFMHLLGRIDVDPETYYQEFVKNDRCVSNQPIKLMSNLTKSILQSIDYDTVRQTRLENFNFLHRHLAKSNMLKIVRDDTIVPMFYPYWVEGGASLRKRLISKSIYIATYWPNVFEWCCEKDIENCLSKNLVALPIDQRNSKEDMAKILEILRC